MLVHQYYSKWKNEWVNFPREEQPSYRANHSAPLYFVNKMKDFYYKIRTVEKNPSILIQDIIHHLPMDKNHNVRCLNGSAHRRATDIIQDVTCPRCLEGTQGNEYWKSEGLFNT